MKKGYGTHIVDGNLVSRRRGELGLTDSYLGALCGVSAGVIRRIESGWAQDELSARFIELLADRLEVPLSALLAGAERKSDPIVDSSSSAQSPGARLGAVLATAGEPVPFEALTRLLGWSQPELDQATIELHQALKHAGCVLVDAGDALSISSDVTAISAEEAIAASKAAFGLRRPNLGELRVVHKLLNGTIQRREDSDLSQSRAVHRLRVVGVLEASDPTKIKSDPLILSEDVAFSLLAD